MQSEFEDPAVEAAYAALDGPIREKAMNLREAIFATAENVSKTGKLIETLKWGQPAYMPQKPKTGTTVRVAPHDEGTLGLHVPCSTTLVPTFRQHYQDTLTFSKNRAILLPLHKPMPIEALSHCIALAFTYHLTNRSVK